jgi:hypothetical protein
VRHRLAVLAFVAWAVAPSVLVAQSSAARDARAGYPRWGSCFSNLTVGGPQRIGIDMAYGKESRPASAGPKDEDLQCSWISTRVGLGAAQLGIGRHRYYGPMGTSLFGQVALLRTFAHPNAGTPDANWVGFEFGGSYLVGISPRLGYFTRVGNGTGSRGMLVWGVGFGF